LICIIYYNL